MTSYSKDKPYTACSFFSGGGLFDYGIKEHFNIIWANELSTKAAISYRANVGSHLYVGDIESISGKDIPQADLYVGTPPCQEFSSDGTNRGEAGELGKLVWTFQDIVATKRPRMFVMENVAGLVRRHSDTLRRLIHSYKNDGYRVTARLIDAADYRVPQHRKRIILVGIREDMGFEFEFPKPIEGAAFTVREAFRDLPNPEDADVADIKLGRVPNHLVTWTSPTPERIQDVIKFPRPNQRRGMRRLPWDKPSFTITHHIGKDGREFLHPDQDRRLSVRETLRVMGIPDTYVIPPVVPIREQYFIVGNGVPTPLGVILSQALKEQLQAAKGDTLVCNKSTHTVQSICG